MIDFYERLFACCNISWVMRYRCGKKVLEKGIVVPESFFSDFQRPEESVSEAVQRLSVEIDNRVIEALATKYHV